MKENKNFMMTEEIKEDQEFGKFNLSIMSTF